MSPEPKPPGAPELPKEIVFRFVQDESYKVLPVTGAWGGITPRGQFIMNFFLETSALPETVTYAVDQGGIGQEVRRVPGGGPHLERRLQIGVICSLSEAATLADWITQRLADVPKNPTSSE